jgi:hypothetical protein
MKLLVLCLALGPAIVSVHGQAKREARLPCAYSGALLRTGAGDIVRFSSNEMKARALAKRDIDDRLKQVDFRETTMVDLLVGSDGSVICAKTITGLPGFSSRIEQALKGWMFRPVTSDGTPVSYLGRVQFWICNEDCGAAGSAMTLLK